MKIAEKWEGRSTTPLLTKFLNVQAGISVDGCTGTGGVANRPNPVPDSDLNVHCYPGLCLADKARDRRHEINFFFVCL